MDEFFGNGFDDPKSAALMSFFAGIANKNISGGLLAGTQAYSEAGERKIRRGLLESQIAENAAQAQQKQALIDATKRKREALPSIWQGGGLLGGEPVAQTIGDVPMFSLPMQAAPMRQAPAGINVQAALAAGYDPKEIQEMDALRNIGLNKVARTIERDDGRGGKETVQLDDFGRVVGSGLPGYIAPVQVNQGDRSTFVRPAAGVSLPINMSPEGRDASARGWAGHNLAQQRFAFDKDNINAGKAPQGYRFKPDGSLEFIPGGPADPNAAKKAAPTEWQGKSSMFGNRAAEADKVITSLTGKYSPFAVNAKLGMEDTPLIGQPLGAAANMALSPEAQQAEQAQRDFVNAVLRLESGAAIGKSEFDNARKQYFPQPGDSKQVIEQKARNRALAIQGLMANARTTNAVEPQQGGASGSWDANSDPLGLRK